MMFFPKKIEDESIWTTAAQTMYQGDVQAFPKLDAYMHPGGPAIEGTIGFLYLFRSNYSVALTAFLIIFDSICVGLICMLAYILRKDLLWPLTILGLLSFQSLYSEASLYIDLTPPSMIASLVLPLLVLLTLYMYEAKGNVRTIVLVLWCALAGLLAAARIDVGSMMTAGLLLFLLTLYDFKKVFYMGVGCVISFCVFDPFMWFDPIEQIRRLFGTATLYYSGTGFAQFTYYIVNLEKVSLLGLMGLFLGLVFLLRRKELPSVMPTRFLAFLLGMTAVITTIFLSAHSQAARYFMPLVFVWEIFLPYFLFTLISNIHFSFLQGEQAQKRGQFILKILFILLLVGIPAEIYVSEILHHAAFAITI
jgi:hypothetical protein